MKNIFAYLMIFSLFISCSQKMTSLLENTNERAHLSHPDCAHIRNRTVSDRLFRQAVYMDQNGSSSSTYKLPVSDIILCIITSELQFLDYSPHYKIMEINKGVKIDLKSYVAFDPRKSIINLNLSDNRNECSKIRNYYYKVVIKYTHLFA